MKIFVNCLQKNVLADFDYRAREGERRANGKSTERKGIAGKRREKAGNDRRRFEKPENRGNRVIKREKRGKKAQTAVKKCSRKKQGKDAGQTQGSGAKRSISPVFRRIFGGNRLSDGQKSGIIESIINTLSGS